MFLKPTDCKPLEPRPTQGHSGPDAGLVLHFLQMFTNKQLDLQHVPPAILPRLLVPGTKIDDT